MESHGDPNFKKAARERWFEWYLDFTKTFGGLDWDNWRAKYDRLGEEWENIESVLYFFASQERWAQLLQLWENIDNYLDLNGYWQKRRHWWTLLAKKVGSARVECKALSERAWTMILIGIENFPKAKEYLQRAWTLRESADLTVQADIANHLAILAKSQGDYPEALKWLDTEKNLIDNGLLPDERLAIRYRIQNLYYCAELNCLMGNRDLAKQQFEEVIELGEKVKWQRFTNYARNSLADILIEESNLDRAENLLRGGLLIAEMARESRRIALYHASFAHLHYARAQQTNDANLPNQAKEHCIKARQYGHNGLRVFAKELMVIEKVQIEKLNEKLIILLASLGESTSYE